jgi:hypothetical protein
MDVDYRRNLPTFHKGSGGVSGRKRKYRRRSEHNNPYYSSGHFFPAATYAKAETG